jgi:hypothetical protein
MKSDDQQDLRENTHVFTERIGTVVTLLNRIWEALGSNLDRDIDYPE